MKDPAKMWNERYQKEAFAYGVQPNEYFKAKLEKLTPGNILLPAEGEGRNAIFAAKSGWEVHAFDLSHAGRAKAKKLAATNGVEINYLVGPLENLMYTENSFDTIGFIYAHLDPTIRKSHYQQLLTYLKPGGHIIFEAFSKKQLEYQPIHNSGGPKNSALLFSIAEIRDILPGISFLELEEKEVFLQEGAYHQGLASVIRSFGKKGTIS